MSTMASQITSLTSLYSTIYSGTDQRKHQSTGSLAFVRRIHRWPVNSPHKGPVFHWCIYASLGLNEKNVVMIDYVFTSYGKGTVYAPKTNSQQLRLQLCHFARVRVIRWFWVCAIYFFVTLLQIFRTYLPIMWHLNNIKITWHGNDITGPIST